MQVTTENKNGSLVIVTEGRVDGSNAPEFQEALKEAIKEGGQKVILDFENLSYISSAGLRVILMFAKQLRRENIAFAACSLIASVKDIFAISGFDKIIPIHASQKDAIAALG